MESDMQKMKNTLANKMSLGVASHRGRAPVAFLEDNINIYTASHKARSHGPAWRTPHAISI